MALQAPQASRALVVLLARLARVAPEARQASVGLAVAGDLMASRASRGSVGTGVSQGRTVAMGSVGSVAFVVALVSPDPVEHVEQRVQLVWAFLVLLVVRALVGCLVCREHLVARGGLAVMAREAPTESMARLAKMVRTARMASLVPRAQLVSLAKKALRATVVNLSCKCI